MNNKIVLKYDEISNIITTMLIVDVNFPKTGTNFHSL